MSKSALIIVDVQNDFLPPDGSLAVPDGRQVIPVIQQLLDKSQWDWDVVLASQDYHPPGHISFATTHSVDPFSERTTTDARGKEYEQTMWPDHCVVGTKGAEIDRDLRHTFDPWKDRMRIVRKGWHRDIEAYSAFEGFLTDPLQPEDDPSNRPIPPIVLAQDTEVGKYLHAREVRKVVVVGLATDYCVFQTAMSAVNGGFETGILHQGVKGIRPEGVEKSYTEFEGAGGVIVGQNGEEWEQALKRWIE